MSRVGFGAGAESDVDLGLGAVAGFKFRAWGSVGVL